jgi:hypothetical protein
MTNLMLEQAIKNLEQYKILREKFNALTHELSGDAWVFCGILQSQIENQVQMANSIVNTAEFTANFTENKARVQS